MTVVSPQSLAEVQPRVRRLTVAEYHRMIDERILREGEPIELLDGLLVLKDRSERGEDLMSIGKRHAFVVQKLVELNAKLKRYGCHLRIGSPVAMPPDDEPEPDGAIAIGGPERYLSRLPKPSDISSVIEAADSSLEHDQTTKLRVYAQTGISQYIIINLTNASVEVYSQPRRGRYLKTEVLSGPDKLRLELPKSKQLVVTAKSLLP